MGPLAHALTALVAEAAESAGHGQAPIPLEPCVPTQDPRHGDYQSNFAFRLGKALRTNPRAVAQALADVFPNSPLVARVEVAGPGFLNLTLADEALAADLVARAAHATFGADAAGSGRTMVLDYSSPNIAKRMHVGHLRSTLIGDAIARLYRYLGWTVIADNHVGDWGTPFGKLIVAWDRSRDDAAYAADPVGELQRLYQQASAAAKEDPAFAAAAREETVKLQKGDQRNRALWQEFCRVSLEEFDGVYRRLDVHFDEVLGESFYRDGLDELVDGLLSKGLAEVDEGAALIRFAPEDGKGLKKNPMLIRKADGAALYGTTDLATIRYRLDRWSPDRIVYVTDVRQQLHFRQLFAAARKIGWQAGLEHVWFGMLKFADGAVASTRSGQVLNLVDVLDTARDRAREVVEQQSPDLSDEDKATIAEAVGVGAVKYTDLSQNPQSDIVFDWDKMLAMEGNTAPYLMYAHARCHSILRKAAEQGLEAGELVLGEPTERELALALVRLPEVAAAAAATYRPNLVADHLFGMAKAYARFYRECKVLDPAQDAAVTASRLTLVQCSARALSLGLGLLGLTPLERM